MAGLWEGATGILQLCGCIRSNHMLYAFTGSFYNPGPFACTLGIVFPVALYEIKSGRSRFMKCLSFVYVAVCAMLLPASMSRTAWLAAAAGSLIVFRKDIRDIFDRNGLWLKLSAVIVPAILTAGAYFIKRDSADGRFLIWKVAVEEIDENPFKGYGREYVGGKYGDAQEQYFAAGKGTVREKMLADAPDFIYNEFIETGMAYGWGWSAVMILLIGGSFVCALKAEEAGIAGGVLASVVVMSASYPFQFTLSIAVIALCVSAGWICCRSKVWLLAGTALSIAGASVLTTDTSTYDERGRFEEGLYLHRQGKWRESNEVMREMMLHCSDPMPLNIIGKNYMGLGEKDSAEFYLRRSSLRCPNRLYPHYLLMKLYLQNPEDSSKAKEEARLLICGKEKVASPAIEEMRRVARIVVEQ